MAIVVKVESSEEPITVAEAKEHLVVTHSRDDGYIASLIRVARQNIEKVTQRSLVTKTLQLYLDDFPLGQVVRLPMPKVATVTNVKYYDTAGTLQTLSSSSYFVDATSTPGRICLKQGYCWPSVETGRPAAVVIEYVAGFGAPVDVPEDLKQAIRLLIGHYYANREDVTSIPYAPVVMPKSAEYLAFPYRVWE